jgi:rhodanese-related sulfurtransferase
MNHRTLGAAALVLGTAAAFVRSPSTAPHGSRLDPANYDAIIPESLAATIMQNGTGGLTLIDLRSAAEFDGYHIPGARRMGDADLDQVSLPAASTIIVYDSATTTASRAWLLLKSQGYRRVYVLSGGIAAWRESILHPPLPPDLSRSGEAEFARQIERSRFFGGSPVPAPSVLPKPRPPVRDSTPAKETFDIGPGGCFY